MNREEALKYVTRANLGILAGVGALVWASIQAGKAMQNLEGVLPRDQIISVADQAPQDTKDALEAVVETYYNSVN